MSEIAFLGGIVGLAVGLVTLLGGLWKVFSLITSLQRRDDALQNEIDSLELFGNGLKGQLDHKYKRVSLQIASLGAILRDCEGYLIKHTEYEPRSRDDASRHTTSQD